MPDIIYTGQNTFVAQLMMESLPLLLDDAFRRQIAFEHFPD